MTPDPFRRRYGYGAARLEIGAPADLESLSVAARTPSSFEGAFAALPMLSCLVVAALLVTAVQTSTSPDPTFESANPLQIALWDGPPAPETLSPPIPPASPVLPAEIPAPEVEPVAKIVDPPAPPDTPVEERAPIPVGDLLAAITPAAAPRPVDDLSNPNPLSDALPTIRPRAEHGTRAAQPAVQMAAADRPAGLDLATSVAPGVAQSADALRPDSTGRSAPSQGAQWSALAARRQLVIESDSIDFATSGAADIRPPVAARRAQTREQVRQTLSTALRRDGRGADWHEVPLDALPDCSPPERQDQLKKRILRAAPNGRECSHSHGRYRFVETRNLNAFLMWSRSNPDAPNGQRPARDACDVLERALRCLDEASIEEARAQ